MNTFRLIQSGFSDAATNMAVDEAIFLNYEEGVSIPTLRLYGWNPASFSIGISQNPELLSLNAAFVRRPTGGGVLFHDKELTYSFTASCLDLGLSSSVKESYAAITAFIIKTYELLGLKANFAKDAPGHSPVDNHVIEPFCRLRNEDYDIIVNGSKMGGNAQKRRKNIFLQHGSIPLITSFDDLSKKLIEAFTMQFDARLTLGKLTEPERECAEILKTGKYSDDGWNKCRRPVETKA